MVARRDNGEAVSTARMLPQAIVVPPRRPPVIDSAVASFPRLFRAPRPQRGTFITLLRSQIARYRSGFLLLFRAARSLASSPSVGRSSFLENSILRMGGGACDDQAPGRPHTRFSITGVSAEGFRPRGTDAPEAEALAPHRRRAA